MKLQTTEALLRIRRRGTYVPGLNFKTRTTFRGVLRREPCRCGIVTVTVSALFLQVSRPCLPVGLSELYPSRASTDSPLICRNLELPSVAVLQNQLITVNSKSSSNASEANALMLFFPQANK